METLKPSVWLKATTFSKKFWVVETPVLQGFRVFHLGTIILTKSQDLPAHHARNLNQRLDDDGATTSATGVHFRHTKCGNLTVVAPNCAEIGDGIHDRLR